VLGSGFGRVQIEAEHGESLRTPVRDLVLEKSRHAFARTDA
jgi:hypothetical protein